MSILFPVSATPFFSDQRGASGGEILAVLLVFSLIHGLIGAKWKPWFSITAGIFFFLACIGPQALTAYLVFLLFTYICFNIKHSILRYLPLLILPATIVSFPISPDQGWQWIAYLVVASVWLRLVAFILDLNDGALPGPANGVLFFRYFLLPPLAPSFLVGSFLIIFPSQLKIDDSTKPRLILKGFQLLALALVYANLLPIFSNPGLLSEIPASIEDLLKKIAGGQVPSRFEVWLTVLFEQIKYFLLFASIAHFRIGMLNLMGFDLPPQFNKPWLSKNLHELWGRYSFYYRNFLLRTLFAPSFLSLRGIGLNSRILLSIFITAGIGNFLVHLYQQYLGTGAYGVANSFLKSWPYYLLLAFGIAISSIRLDGVYKNSLCSWGRLIPRRTATLVFFCLIHLFSRHSPGTDNLDSLIALRIAFFGR